MYKFIFEDEEHTDPYGITDPYHTKRIEFQVKDNSDLDEMLDAFENFLKANGYHFDGNVDIVKEDSTDDYESKIDYNMWDQKSQPFKPFAYSNTYKDMKVTYK